ncbi:3-hydroxyisobutyrate dehydrogenase, mitochondrial-like [Brevipalpus obovatus]|uniref:3-hydroxyisobutyrate dehydrogenase, mitochondrial-like n=1 Tax=Brevipalpus obovatus TaxID=246614 RepID=UPI003D9F4962
MFPSRLITRAIQRSAINFTQKCGSHVGFIGIGFMGTPMATHLMDKGNSLVVYDINKAAVERFKAKGAQEASCPAEMAEKCDRIFTMVPSDPYVIEVFGGKDGLLSKAKKGSILMDCSTVHPETSKKLFTMCSEKGIGFLDTPVAGAVPAAKAGTLTFMVGGSGELVKKVESLLLCMGKRVVHCGDIGAGAAAKICNNMMLAISMIGTSETLNLAQNLGLSAEMMTEILNISSGRTWVSEIYNPVPGILETSPSSKNYEPGFKVELLAKDLGISQSCANKTAAITPMGSLAFTIYKTMVNNGYGEKDFSAAYQFLLKKGTGGIKV